MLARLLQYNFLTHVGLILTMSITIPTPYDHIDFFPMNLKLQDQYFNISSKKTFRKFVKSKNDVVLGSADERSQGRGGIVFAPPPCFVNVDS